MHDSLTERANVRHRWSESDRFVPRSFVRPLQRFMDTEASGAIFMLVAALAALAWANSPWWRAQETLWSTDLTIHLGHLAHIDLTLVEWVNDALMAIFFFVVGLEIKRELVHGELRDPKKASLPAIAALGGMLVPAGFYLLLNTGTDASPGWGIPMATDIAFAVAIVALAGPKVPSAAKVFLLTLAIADDIGAIVVIAIFYTEKVSMSWMAVSAATVLAIVIARRLMVRSLAVYVPLGLFLWFAVHETGVHATLAGVALGLLTPAWSFFDPRHFAEDAGRVVTAIADTHTDGVLTDEEYEIEQGHLENMHRLVVETQSPLERLEHGLARWVAFVIVPLFAFSNAGVRLTSEATEGFFTNRVILGVGLGLILGKTVGVFTFTWVAEHLGLGSLPDGVDYRHVLGLAATSGIGFTVALFVASLAFEPAQGFSEPAKIGILAGSVIAGVIGYSLLRTSPAAPAEQEGVAAH